MRKKHTAAHENHERWLVSYADFITLLFAFFVVMFASNQNDRHRAKMVSDSVRDALEHGTVSSRLSSMLGKGRHEGKAADHSPNASPPEPQAKETQPADLTRSMANLEKGLAAELLAGKVQIKLEGRGLVIDLREAAFFASGDDGISPGSYPILEKIALEIRAVPNQVRLEGYTDALPIHNSRFRSNWDLSAARAIALLNALADRYQVDRARMAIAGYGENAPADTNDTEEGRAHNRRVALVLLTEEGQKAEPAAAAKRTL
ncbi:MAG TPA: flagellar motor protein MotB [Candidatus Sulfopaludibacter sp.]|nr:flagellar motor protein MotB [Candidatus Sulfopaludibacter sp.]